MCVLTSAACMLKLNTEDTGCVCKHINKLGSACGGWRAAFRSACLCFLLSAAHLTTGVLGSKEGTQVTRLVWHCPYLLSHLAGSVLVFKSDSC